MPLTKWSQEPELSSSRLLIRDVSILILVVVRLQLTHCHHICKQEGLHNKVDNMANALNPPITCRLVPVYLLFHIGLDRTIEDVIWRGVVSYNSSKLVYNTVILQDREKDRELVFATMAKDLLESK
jgi:hypothetical protein